MEGERENQGTYLMEKSFSERRTLTRESGTLLFNSFRISESGLLIPELALAASTSSSASATTSCVSLKDELDDLLAVEQEERGGRHNSDFKREALELDFPIFMLLLNHAISFFFSFPFSLFTLHSSLFLFNFQGTKYQKATQIFKAPFCGDYSLFTENGGHSWVWLGPIKIHQPSPAQPSPSQPRPVFNKGLHFTNLYYITFVFYFYFF